MRSVRSVVQTYLTRRSLLKGGGVGLFIAVSGNLIACAGSSGTPSTGATVTTSAPRQAPAHTPAPSASPSTRTTSLVGAGKESEIVVARSATLRTLDPTGGLYFWGVYETDLTDHIYETLIYTKPQPGNFEPVGVLAEKWSQSDDGRTWTFQLIKGVKFQSGDVFDAAAVKANVDNVLNSKTSSGYGDVSAAMDPDGIKVIDANTISFTTKQVYPNLLAVPMASLRLAAPSLIQGDPNTWWQKPGGGTGPYKLVSFTPDAVELAAFDGYRIPGINKIKSFRYRAISEAATRMAALENSEVQLIDQMPLDTIADLKKRGMQTDLVPTIDFMFVNMNCTRPPFNNAKARSALMYAFDRASIVKDVLSSAAEVIAQPAPQGFLGYNPNLKPYPYDPAKAKSLLSDAGIKTPVKLTMIQANGWYPNDTEVAQALAGQAQAAGFDISIQVLEPATFTSARRAGKFDLAYFGGGNGFDPDPRFYEGRIVHDNWGTGFEKLPEAKPILDQIDAARTELDGKKRDQMYQDIEAKLYVDGPRAMLYRNHWPWAFAATVKGLQFFDRSYRIFGATIG